MLGACPAPADVRSLLCFAAQDQRAPLGAGRKKKKGGGQDGAGGRARCWEAAGEAGGAAVRAPIWKLRLRTPEREKREEGRGGKKKIKKILISHEQA